MTTLELDEAKLEQLMGQMVGHMTGSTLCFAIWLGDKLGLYRAMTGAGPQTADELAHETQCHPRLVREWLDGQAAGGLVQYDAGADTYALTPEQAAVLADDSSPTFVARAMAAIGAFYYDIDKLAAAYRSDGAIPWQDHHPNLFEGTEWFFRTGYQAELPAWIAELDGVAAKLERGGSVADIGCGHGASCAVIAAEYPNARVHGFDFHGPSVATARERARDAGVDNVTVEIADARSYPGTYDLICFFDCLHDMGDPLGAVRYARQHLAEDGTVLLVEPFAMDGRERNLTENPMAALLYIASQAVCLPNSLSQDVGAAFGAQAGEERLRDLFTEAGFTRFRRAAETPLNLILEARP